MGIIFSWLPAASPSARVRASIVFNPRSTTILTSTRLILGCTPEPCVHFTVFKILRTRDYYLAESRKSEGISVNKEVRASFVADNRDGL